MTLSKIFQLCAYEIEYKNVGDDVSYAFLEKNDNLYIFFQGSNGVLDWVFNFLFTKKVYKQFRVHRGFLHCYQQVRDIMLDKIYAKSYDEVIVVGYSHGGALCQLAIEDIKYHFPNQKHIGYAFESPRCIKTPKKYKYMWNNLYVVRNGCDLITHLPPRLFGFDDLGAMIHIKGDTSLVKNHLPKCIKYHYPECVLNGLMKWEK